MVFSPSSTFSYRNFQVSATLDTVLPLKAQFPWRTPYQERCLLVCFLSLIPALHGRSKDFCGLWGSPPNNHKKCIRRFFYRDRQHPAHRQFSPFHGVTTVFQHWPPALLVLWPIPHLCGGSCFSRNASSML